ncbi:MAG: PIN domain-containing protein [Methanobacteriota archaeon]
MQGDIKTKRVTLDSNVLISAVKENEKYSSDCKELLSLVGTSFLLYQPTITITELYNGIGRTKGEIAAKKALKVRSYLACCLFSDILKSRNSV